MQNGKKSKTHTQSRTTKRNHTHTHLHGCKDKGSGREKGRMPHVFKKHVAPVYHWIKNDESDMSIKRTVKGVTE